MKKVFTLLLVVVVIYIAKPVWEKPASNYIDLSFLEPVDEKVEAFVTSKPFTDTVHSISNATDKVIHFILSKVVSTQEVQDTKTVEPPIEQQPTDTFSIHSIEIGDTKEEVYAQLGHPKRVSKNEYHQSWHTFHQNYTQFIMVSFNKEHQVNALYTNDTMINSNDGLRYGMPKEEVRKLLGEPITEIRKGLNVFLLQQTDGHDVFKMGDLYVYVFYDVVEGETVTAIQLITETLEQQKDAIYANKSTDLQNGFALQLFDLTNASRVRHGLSSLEWDDLLAITALKHSTDMAINDFFNHDNKQGQSPFDRMQANNIHFQAAGENLAYGQSSSIFAHEGLMNSPGHRENILLDTYSHLGVGVDFNEKFQPYFTENFILK